MAPSKDYQSVCISSPKLTKGESYSLYLGGASPGDQSDGLYEDGNYKDGTKIVDFTVSESVTWLNESGITTKGSSRPGGEPMPKGGQMPSGE